MTTEAQTDDPTAEDAAILADAAAAIHEWTESEAEETPDEPAEEPEKATPEETPEAPEEEPDDADEILAKLKADREERLQRRTEEEKRAEQEAEFARMKAENENLRKMFDDFRKDPTSVIRSREDYEALTARILGEDSKSGADVAKLVEERVAAKLQEEIAPLKQQAEAQAQERRRQAFDQIKKRFTDHTGDAEKYPLLSKLPEDERLERGMAVTRALGDPTADDATIAKYAEAELRQTLKRLGMLGEKNADGNAEEKAPQTKGKKQPKTLTNGQAAESAASINAEDNEEAEALKMIAKFRRESNWS